MTNIIFEDTKKGFKLNVGFVETPRDEQPSRIELLIIDIIETRFLNGN